MSNIRLSVEEREYLKSVFDRMNRMKPLKIIEQELGEWKSYESDIEPEDLQISTLTSQENYLVLPIHDDHLYLGRYKMHPNGSKVVGYKVSRKPLGVVEIEVFGGIKVRGEDLRSETFKDKQRKSYFFVYLEEQDKQFYQEYGEIKDLNKLNEKQEIGLSRIQEGKSLYPKFLPFILKFEQYLKTFRVMPSTFSDKERIEKNLNDYLELKDLVADYLRIQFIFGSITTNELAILVNKSKELFDLVNSFANNWKTMNEEQISEYFRTKIATAAQKLIDPRKIDINEELGRLSEDNIDRKTAIGRLSVIGGYLLEGDDFAPSLLEIERRKDKYKDFQKQESEDQFLRLLREKIKGK